MALTYTIARGGEACRAAAKADPRQAQEAEAGKTGDGWHGLAVPRAERTVPADTLTGTIRCGL